MDTKLLALFGLKYNPFTSDIPLDALVSTPRFESFCWRVEHAHLREGGFALITGDPGTGKSVALRLLADKLSRLRDVTVGSITHPQSNLADFYREMGDVFNVPLRPHNRWAGCKVLRQCWQAHIETTLSRPVLLIDEAQEMASAVLSELRLLSSLHFDSQIILSVVLAGDARLTERFRRDDLLPLGSRIRTRLAMEYISPEELRGTLKHLAAAAGNAKLLTPDLVAALADHAGGNYRTLTTMAAELLAVAAQRELSQLDEQLFLDVFAAPRASTRAVVRTGTREAPRPETPASPSGRRAAASAAASAAARARL
jgi:general secretion pathway protein A